MRPDVPVRVTAGSCGLAGVRCRRQYRGYETGWSWCGRVVIRVPVAVPMLIERGSIALVLLAPPVEALPPADGGPYQTARRRAPQRRLSSTGERHQSGDRDVPWPSVGQATLPSA